MDALGEVVGSELSSISRDLAQLRTAAAAALKNIDTVYREVMGGGCNDEFLNDERHCSNGVDVEIETEGSSSNTSVTGLSKSSQQGNSLCQRCHKVITPRFRAFESPCVVLHKNKCPKHVHCSRCGRLKSCLALSHAEPAIHHFHEHDVQEVHQTDVKQKEHVTSGNHKRCLKVTVPEPFQMTLRDESKKELREQKKKQLKKQLKEVEEKELKKKFRSNPVPSHTYLPMYQKLAEESEKQKKKRKEHAGRIMESAKPFASMENKKNLYRTHSVPQLTSEEGEPVLFKAKPVPKHVLSISIDERLKNSEVARKVRIQQRAQEMLQQASLPFSRKASFKRSLSAFNLRDESKDKRCIKMNVQNAYVFSFSESKCKEAMKEWNSKVSKFHLSCQLSESRTQTSSIKLSKSVRKCVSSPKKPLYDVPVRMTMASMLRENAVRQELSSGCTGGKKDNWQNDCEKKRFKENLANRLKMAALSSDSQRELERKLQSYRESRRNRQLEYEKELQEMRKRIERRPLLVERHYDKGKPKSENKDPNSEGSDTSVKTTLSESEDESTEHQSDPENSHSSQ